MMGTEDTLSDAELAALAESMLARAREVVRRSRVVEAWEGIGATVRPDRKSVV